MTDILKYTLGALLGDDGRNAQREAWDRARAVATELSCTLPTICELESQRKRPRQVRIPTRDELTGNGRVPMSESEFQQYVDLAKKRGAEAPCDDYSGTGKLICLLGDSSAVVVDFDIGCVLGADQ